MKRCETCGRFLPRNHLQTAWHSYDIDHSAPVAVYSQATANRLNERLDCRDCSMPDYLLWETKQPTGTAVGFGLPGGWERCSHNATQADYTEVAS